MTVHQRDEEHNYAIIRQYLSPPLRLLVISSHHGCHSIQEWLAPMQVVLTRLVLTRLVLHCDSLNKVMLSLTFEWSSDGELHQTWKKATPEFEQVSPLASARHPQALACFRNVSQQPQNRVCFQIRPREQAPMTRLNVRQGTNYSYSTHCGMSKCQLSSFSMLFFVLVVVKSSLYKFRDGG